MNEERITHKGRWRGRAVGVAWDGQSGWCLIAYAPDCAGPWSAPVDEVQDLREVGQ